MQPVLKSLSKIFFLFTQFHYWVSVKNGFISFDQGITVRCSGRTSHL